MYHCIVYCSTVSKYTSYNNIGIPGSAGKLAPAKTPSTAGTTATEETPATAGMKATAEKPTSGTPRKAGNPATVTVEHQELKGSQRSSSRNAINIRLTLISLRPSNSSDAKSSRDTRNSTDGNDSRVFAEICEKLVRTAKFGEKNTKKKE